MDISKNLLSTPSLNPSIFFYTQVYGTTYNHPIHILPKATLLRSTSACWDGVSSKQPPYKRDLPSIYLILWQNECWNNFMYWKLSQCSFFGEFLTFRNRVKGFEKDRTKNAFHLIWNIFLKLIFVYILLI